jgi:two-component system, response regulator YesN
MESTTDNINKSIYDICVLIHNLTRLNVEFLDDKHNSSFKLISSEVSVIVQSSRNQTITFIDTFLRDKSPNDFFFHTDNLQLSYLGVGLWEENFYKGTIIVGPFLSDSPNEAFISSIIERNKLPLGHKQLIEQYYKTLTILKLAAYKSIGYIMVNLTTRPVVNANMLLSKNENFITTTKEENEIGKEKFHTGIELRYKTGRDLMNAVRKGSKDDALKLFSFFNFNPAHRVPNNPLRANKNLGFSLSAMLRIAAEEGGVSPVYLHNTSDMFASLIEKASSIADLESTLIKMVSEYCDLVKIHSTAGFSPTISKAIDYINLNFDSQLSLSLIADKININPSHLSRQFKKETNMTITEFINKKRVDEAKILIEQSNNSITEISMMAGFESHNYFYAVFKQITGLTPKGYLDKVRKVSNVGDG